MLDLSEYTDPSMPGLSLSLAEKLNSKQRQGSGLAEMIMGLGIEEAAGNLALANGNGLDDEFDTLKEVGQLATPLGITTIVFGAGSAAIGAYNAYNSKQTVRGDWNGLLMEASKALGRVQRDATAQLRNNYGLAAYSMAQTRKNVAMLRQTVIRSCDVLLGSLNEMAEQLHLFSAAGDSLSMEVHRGFDSVHKRLDEKEMDKLKVSCKKVHRRYKSCLLSLTKGDRPHVSDIERLMDSAEGLAAKVEIACDKIPEGDPRRLPLMAFRTFAARAEVDARKMRGLMDDGYSSSSSSSSSISMNSSRSQPLSSSGLDQYSVELLNSVLTAVAVEVETMWYESNSSLYAVGVELAPVLAQYTLLGRALEMALEDKSPIVSSDGTMTIPSGDERVVFDDGMDELRWLFGSGVQFEGRQEKLGPLGNSLSLEKISDLIWYTAWKGQATDMKVKDVPQEVPMVSVLGELGAPMSESEKLTADKRSVLQRTLLPYFLQQAQEKISQELQWAVAKGAVLELVRPTEFVPFGSCTTEDLLVDIISDENGDDDDDQFEDAADLEWHDCEDDFYEN